MQCNEIEVYILNELGQTGKQQTERVKKIGTGGIRTSAHVKMD